MEMGRTCYQRPGGRVSILVFPSTSQVVQLMRAQLCTTSYQGMFQHDIECSKLYRMFQTRYRMFQTRYRMFQHDIEYSYTISNIPTRYRIFQDTISNVPTRYRNTVSESSSWRATRRSNRWPAFFSLRQFIHPLPASCTSYNNLRLRVVRICFNIITVLASCTCLQYYFRVSFSLKKKTQ